MDIQSFTFYFSFSEANLSGRRLLFPCIFSYLDHLEKKTEKSCEQIMQKNVISLDISDKIKYEINDFLDRYYDKYTGLYLKSKDFIKNLNKLDRE